MATLRTVLFWVWGWGHAIAFAQGAPSAVHFDWVEAEVVPGEGPVPVALALPVRIDGHDCLAQLDTGAPGVAHFHRPFERAAARPVVIEALGLRHVVAGPPDLSARLDTCHDELLLSLGNRFFDRGTLRLDLPHQQLSFENGSILGGDSLASHFFYPQWDLADSGGGHIVFEISDAQGHHHYAMLDTGAASFGISALSAAAWLELTGLPVAPGPGVKVFQVNSWGKQIDCYRVRSVGRWTVGVGQPLPWTDVSYCDLPAFKPGQRLVALVGLRGLGGQVLTLDYPARRWRLAAASP